MTRYPIKFEKRSPLALGEVQLKLLPASDSLVWSISGTSVKFEEFPLLPLVGYAPESLYTP